LRISAEQVYVQAGILNPDDDQVRSVELAILGDPVLSERQKQALLEIYQSFRASSTLDDEPAEGTTAPLADEERAPDVRTGVPGQATTTEGA